MAKNIKQISGYGWTRSHPDKLRLAKKFNPSIAPPGPLPTIVDLRTSCIPKVVYDQGDEGSCVGQATAGLAQSLMIKQGKPSFAPSRNFIYYQARLAQGTVEQDSGSTLSEGMSVLSTYGVPPEVSWPYTGNRWLWQPWPNVYAEAAIHRVSEELNLVQDINHFRACLAAGYPFVGGFEVFESFESDTVAQTGIVPMPTHRELNDGPIGGHAILICGYNDLTQKLLKNGVPEYDADACKEFMVKFVGFNGILRNRLRLFYQPRIGK